VLDSTNVERPGFTPSEKVVGATFMRQFQNCDERIIVTTFASNVHRVQQVLDAAAQCGRKVAVTGRSMENMMKVSTELGYMKVPKNTLVDINKLKGLPKNKQVIVTTGSQGEEMSALYRMAFSTHKQVEIGAGDKVTPLRLRRSRQRGHGWACHQRAVPQGCYRGLVDREICFTSTTTVVRTEDRRRRRRTTVLVLLRVETSESRVTYTVLRASTSTTRRNVRTYVRTDRTVP